MDYHHTVEDIGIAWGQAFENCLGDKRGISRYGQFLLPMDETLVLCAVDLSGRAYLLGGGPAAQKVGDFDTELGKEFWLGFLRNCPASSISGSFAGEHPPYSGGGVQGGRPGAEAGRGPGRKTPGRDSQHEGTVVR